MLRKLKVVALLSVFAIALTLYFDVHATSLQQSGGPAKPLDPKDWGSNHAGKPVPDFIHGDECLFCHRNDIGPGWQKNAHGLTVRQREDAPELQEILKQPALSGVASQVEYFMGSHLQVCCTHVHKKECARGFALPTLGEASREPQQQATSAPLRSMLHVGRA